MYLPESDKVPLSSLSEYETDSIVASGASSVCFSIEKLKVTAGTSSPSAISKFFLTDAVAGFVSVPSPKANAVVFIPIIIAPANNNAANLFLLIIIFSLFFCFSIIYEKQQYLNSSVPKQGNDRSLDFFFFYSPVNSTVFGIGSVISQYKVFIFS